MMSYGLNMKSPRKARERKKRSNIKPKTVIAMLFCTSNTNPNANRNPNTTTIITNTKLLNCVYLLAKPYKFTLFKCNMLMPVHFLFTSSPTPELPLLFLVHIPRQVSVHSGVPAGFLRRCLWLSKLSSAILDSC